MRSRLSKAGATVPSDRALLGMVGGYALVAALIWPGPFADLVTTYAQQLWVIPVVLLMIVPIAAVLVAPTAPLAYLREAASSRLPRLAIVTLTFCVGMAAFTTYKVAIPSLVPFYLDPWLADLDAVLHGIDPGLMSHSLVPGWAEPAMATLYGFGWFVFWFGLVGFAAFLGNHVVRQQYFWTMAITMAVLGTVVATLASSVGPVLYDRIYGGDRFSGLMTLVDASAAGPQIRNASNYLYATYLGGPIQAGTGISAMPSMHLAITTLNTMFLLRLSKVVGTISVAYLAVIQLGSVYLGWHYAIDGYVSILAVVAIWLVVGAIQQQSRPVREMVAPDYPAPDGTGTARP